MKYKKLLASAAAITLALSAVQIPTASANTHEGYTEIELDSGAEKTAEIVSVNVPITVDGKELRLIATGLNNDNKDAFVRAIEENYKPDNKTPLYITDKSLVDAEKWDAEIQLFDSSLCWAAAASQVLWLSGWAQEYGSPVTGKPFASEDEVFDYYIRSFSDSGGETSEGIKWFFNGTYFISGSGTHTSPINGTDPTNGLQKDFVASKVTENYDTVDSPEALSHLLDIDQSCENACAVGLSIDTAANILEKGSGHAVTAGGVIYDPNEQQEAEKYKAIIIIDSDNDADSGTDVENTDFEFTDINAEYKKQLEQRSAYPNSMSVYDLELRTNEAGQKVWEIVGYSPYDSDYYGISSLQVLPLYSKQLIEENQETDGTKNQHENADLFIDYMYTTNSDTQKDTPTIDDINENSVKTFSQSDNINLNVFVANQAGALLDKDYPGGNTLTFDWKAVSSDGENVYTGTEKLNADIYSYTETSFFLHLNNKDGVTEKWEPGDYTLTLSVNADKAVTESYYYNNEDAQFSFTVVKDEEAQPTDTDEPEKTPKEDTDNTGEDSQDPGTDEDDEQQDTPDDSEDEDPDEDTENEDTEDEDPDEDEDTAGDTDKDKESSEKTGSSDTQGSSQDNANTPGSAEGTNTANPKTGITTGALAFIALSGAAMAASKKRRK